MLAALFLLVALSPTLLQCEGTIWLAKPVVEKPTSYPIKGTHIQISEKWVEITGLGFSLDGRYKVTAEDAAIVRLKHADDPGVDGYINRLSGEISLKERAADDKSFLRVYMADCKTARPLF